MIQLTILDYDFYLTLQVRKKFYFTFRRRRYWKSIGPFCYQKLGKRK